MATSRENKTISQFKSALIGGGARPNLFEVEMPLLPNGIAWDADSFRFLYSRKFETIENGSPCEECFQSFHISSIRLADETGARISPSFGALSVFGAVPPFVRIWPTTPCGASPCLMRPLYPGLDLAPCLLMCM